MNSSGSHRRKNLLTGESVLVSPHRTQRPWQGQLETSETPNLPAHDPECYLCPRSERSGGQRNPDYRGPWAFDNDFPALNHGPVAQEAHPLFQSKPESGHCRVVCYSERHDLTFSKMTDEQLLDALKYLILEFQAFDQRTDVGYVQIFENRGEMMGCSNPHPHAQIWATRSIPNEPGKELREQTHYHGVNNSVLLLDYLEAELAAGDRLVHVNDQAISLVPFWATWPFETLLLPRTAVQDPADMSDTLLAGFAECLQSTLRAYDALFEVPMPYSMGFHPRPSDGLNHPGWQFHAHCYPPLLRSATVRKHMVGFEMLGMPQRDITPEAAAEQLRKALQKADKQ